MNHRNLKIIIASCWALAAVVLIFGFLLYSSPGIEEHQAVMDAVAAYDAKTKLEAQLANPQNDTSDLRVAIEAKGAERDRLFNKANLYRECRIAGRHRFYSISISFIGISLAFAILLFITRGPHHPQPRAI